VNSANTPLHNAFDVLCDLEIKKIRKIIKLNSFSIPLIAQSSLAEEYRPGASMFPFGAASSVKPSEPIKRYISDNIYAMDNSHWHYIFKSEQDYFMFLNIFSDFFAGNEVNPNFELVLKPHCKTRLCPVLNSIYPYFQTSSLKKDEAFLTLLKNLSIFKNQTSTQIYFDIIRFKEYA
jgi:hypothetical protein